MLRATVKLVSASNDDFNIISSTNLNFSPGNTEQTIAITTTGDSFIEGNEVFQVILSTSNPDVQIGDGITTITILDDDGKCIWQHGCAIKLRINICIV